MEVSPGVFQNNRMGTIFKDKNKFDGQAYWLDGKLFSDDGGKTWVTNSDSFVPITFPFIAPKSEKIIRKQEEE